MKRYKITFYMKQRVWGGDREGLRGYIAGMLGQLIEDLQVEEEMEGLATGVPKEGNG